MKTELLAEKTALVMQNKNGGFRDLYGSLSTVHWWADHQVISAFWSNNYLLIIIIFKYFFNNINFLF